MTETLVSQRSAELARLRKAGGVRRLYISYALRRSRKCLLLVPLILEGQFFGYRCLRFPLLIYLQRLLSKNTDCQNHRQRPQLKARINFHSLACSRLALSLNKIGCVSAIKLNKFNLYCSQLSLSLQHLVPRKGFFESGD